MSSSECVDLGQCRQLRIERMHVQDVGADTVGLSGSFPQWSNLDQPNG